MMRKIVLLLFAIVLTVGNSWGQAAANRTWKTKVSDALGLMPAPNQGEYNRLMEDLVSTGSEGVDMLTMMFDGPNNVPVSYALSGWSAYVSDGSHEAARKTFAEGIVRGLEKSKNPEVSAFYIRLLQQSGKGESVSVLSKYVADPNLGSPALNALVSNGTAEAKTAITKAVLDGQGDKYTLAQAIGAAEITTDGVESVLLEWLGKDAKADKAVYYALSKIGTPVSLPALRRAAETVKYQEDPTNATSRYIALTKRLQANGQEKIASSEAKRMMAKAQSTGAEQTRIAAAEILLPQQKAPTLYVLKGLKDPSRAYRNSLLGFAAPYADDTFYTLLAESVSKLKSGEAKCDVIRYLGNQKAQVALPVVLICMEAPDPALSSTAMWAATRIGGKEVPATLTRIMGGGTAEDSASMLRAKTAQQCLEAYPGNINSEVIELVKNKGNVLGLEVLASRRAKESAPVVLGLLNNPDTKVSKAAYMALPYVVSSGNLQQLCTLLEQQSDVTQLSAIYLQDGLVAALRDGAPVDQLLERYSKSGAKQSLYYAVFAKADVPGALEYLSKGFASPLKADKDNSFYALLNLNDWDAADKLIEIAAGNDADYAPRALEAYIQRVKSSELTPENKVLMLSEALAVAGSNHALSSSEASRLQALALQELDNNKTFQGLILAGQYLNAASAEVQQTAVQTVLRTALAHKEYYGPVVAELLNRAVEVNKDKDSGYQREEVQKHLASLPAQGGYVSMFNGHDLSGWKGLVENPIARSKMKPEELAKKQKAADEEMHRNWQVNNGLLEYVGHGFDNLCTDKKYGDFEMYVDWKLYPEGTEADAGIYLRGTPQVQIWDTSRRNVGAQVGSGGLYNNQIHSGKPSYVADNDMGMWNTMYIKMVGDRVTVLLNGQKVVDNVILENFWDRNQSIFPVEQIELQAHGSKVAFRNLFIRELPQAKPVELSTEERTEGFKLLFDGTNMHGWLGNTRDYVSEDGAIVLYPGNGGGGNLYTKDEYKDFVLRFEFLLTEGANNGIGIRTPLEGDAAYVGMEIQVLDNEAPIYSQLEKYQYHGSVYGVIPAKRGFLKPVGEWNSEEIRIKGNDIRVILNGEVILEGNIAEASKNGTIDHKDHPGLKNEKGHIGFLGHGSLVKFRNLRVKEL